MRGDLGPGKGGEKPWTRVIELLQLEGEEPSTRMVGLCRNKGSLMRRRANGLAKQAEDRCTALMSTVPVLTTVLQSLGRSPVPERE